MKCQGKIEKLSLQKNSLKKNIDKLKESLATEHLSPGTEQSQRTLKKEEELDEVIEKFEEVLGDIYEFEQIMKIITDEK